MSVQLPHRGGSLRRWFEDRTGLGAFLDSVASIPVHGGAGIGHAFAAAAGALLLVLLSTGVALALEYVPAPDEAWASVWWIQHRVTHGAFTRALHRTAGEALLVVLALHVGRALFAGSYRRPREVGWWLSLGMLALVLAALVTGMRLPWDQHAYWALRIELGVAEALPGGGLLGQMLGGAELGRTVLSRMYALHAVVLPLGLVACAAMGVWIATRHGRVAGPHSDVTRVEPYWPRQAAVDGAFVFVVLLAVLLVAAFVEVATLGSPADPTRHHPARPEWFLMPLYALRAALPESVGALAVGIVPGLLALWLLALPWLDRGGPGLRARLPWAAPVLVLFCAMGALAVASVVEDANDEEHQRALAEERRRAERASELAAGGIPPDGPLAMLARDPWTRGRELYEQKCNGCHGLDGRRGEGEIHAPDHTGFGSRAWLLGLLLDPEAPHYFGRTGHAEQMPSQRRLGEENLRAVVEFLYAQAEEPQDPGEINAALAARGERVLRDRCLGCHLFRGEGDELGTGGPDLGLYPSRTWIARQIAEPGARTQYGALHRMPAFGDELTREDLEVLTAFVRLQRFREPRAGQSTRDGREPR